jgi:hypothetical protein
MGKYRPLYHFCIEHDYFDRNRCRAIGCHISPEGGDLLHRRGLLFRQLSSNEWTIFFDDMSTGVNTGSDVLTLELDITDPTLVTYTKWAEIHPDSAYLLKLPGLTESLDASDCIEETAYRRKIGVGFCTVQLQFTEEMWQAAKNGNPQMCRLQFHACERKWEYLFIPQNGKTGPFEKIHLEEINRRLSFIPFTKTIVYGKNVLYTVSKDTIAMKEHYPFHLKLILFSEGNRQKQVLLREVPLPSPDAFIAKDSETIRQICYY